MISVAKQYQNKGLDLVDLIQEGNIGMLEAAYKFDETRGYRFISYAVWWIRQSIMRAISEQCRTVRVPMSQIVNMSKIKGVLFDMDGVIFDTEKVYLDAWTRVCRKYGYDLKSETYISVMGTGKENTIVTFKKALGDDIPIESMYKDKDIIIKEAVESGSVPLKPGALEILEYLREHNIKTALATSAKRWRADSQLENAGIKKFFDVVICGDEITNLKPDPEIFLKAGRKLGLKPEECIVIEDSQAGIKAAYSAGMYGIHVEDLKEADDTIKKYCKANFKNLMEIQKYIEANIL